MILMQRNHQIIIYLDCDNLYGVTISNFLPLNDFKWLTSEEFEKINFENVPDDSSDGYILEVDIEYFKELHD